MRTRTLLAIAALMIASFSAFLFINPERDQVAHIGDLYGFAWNDHAADLSDKYTENEAMNKFPAFYAWMAANGYTVEQFMQIAEGVAAHNDWVWKHHAADYTATCQSRASLVWPGGKYNVDFRLFVAFGEYRGQGTSKFYSGGTIAQGGTELFVDHAGWVGDKSFRNIFQSSTWNLQDNNSYNESFLIEGFRLEGKKTGFNDPSYFSSGCAIWDAGETSEIRRVYSANFNTDGFSFIRGTPATAINCSAFHNKRYGFAGLGGALNNYRIIAPSGDNNGRFLFGAIPGLPGDGRVPGGTWNIYGFKLEKYGEPNVFGTKGDCMGIFEGEGDVKLNIYGGTVGSHDCWTDALIVMRNIHSNGFKANVSGVRGYDFFNVLQVEGQRVSVPNTQHSSFDFQCYATPSGIQKFESFNGQHTISNGSSATLGYLKRDPQTGQAVGSFNYSAGTPVKQWQESSTPLPCSWTCSAWSACENGTQTRTCTSTGNCTGTPNPYPTQQACSGSPVHGCTDPNCINYNEDATVDDGSCTECRTTGEKTVLDFEHNGLDKLIGNPISATVYVGSNGWKARGQISNGTFKVTNRNVKYLIDIPGVQYIVLKGATITESNWGFICNGVKVAPNGEVWINGSPSGQTVPRTKSDVQIIFPQPHHINTLFNGTSQFHAAQLEVEEFAVY